MKIKARENTILKQDMCRMEERVENLEMQERRNDVIISGAALPSRRVGETMSQVVIDMLKQNMNYNLPKDNVLNAYRMGGKPNHQMAKNGTILVKLCSDSCKKDLILACKSNKPTNLYINDSLTPLRSEILYILRRAKKRVPNKISTCGSVGGRVYVWTKAPVSTNKDSRTYINSKQHLSDFCSKNLNMSLDELLN